MQNAKKRCYTSQKRKANVRMALQSERPLDSTDWKILRELQSEARLSYNQLGRRVGLSVPAAAERVRKLEDAGVITGYGAQVNPAKVGLPLLALIQLHCTPGKCLLKTSSAEEFPEVLEMYKLSGSHCPLPRGPLPSIRHLQPTIQPLQPHQPPLAH